VANNVIVCIDRTQIDWAPTAVSEPRTGGTAAHSPPARHRGARHRDRHQAPDEHGGTEGDRRSDEQRRRDLEPGPQHAAEQVAHGQRRPSFRADEHSVVEHGPGIGGEQERSGQPRRRGAVRPDESSPHRDRGAQHRRPGESGETEAPQRRDVRARLGHGDPELEAQRRRRLQDDADRGRDLEQAHLPGCDEPGEHRDGDDQAELADHLAEEQPGEGRRHASSRSTRATRSATRSQS
jgi:hypothetical protein